MAKFDDIFSRFETIGILYRRVTDSLTGGHHARAYAEHRALKMILYASCLKDVKCEQCNAVCPPQRQEVRYLSLSLGMPCV